MRRPLRAIAVLAALVAFVVESAPQTTGSGPAVRSSDVDEVFAAYSGTASPGCQLGVLLEGEFIYEKAYGMADLERRVPLTTAAPIAVGSLAKQFTGAVVAQLARDGKFSLDDPVRKHFPELPAYAGGITIGNLIHHTSGLRDYYGLIAIGGEPDDFHTSESEFLELMSRQRALNFEPGTQYLYSNSEYVLLAILVRRSTGKSLHQVADEILFSPLGMKHTHFDDKPAELIPDRVLGYSPRGTGFVLNTNASDGVTGDGALCTTVEDLREWDRYLSGSKAEELFGGTTLKNGTAVPYGFGLSLNRLFGYRLIAHGGGFKGYRAELFKFPEQGLTVVCLCNTSGADPTSLVEKVSAMYLGRKIAPPRAAQPSQRQTVAVSEDDLARYAGDYYNPDLDATYEVRVAQGKLGFRCKHSIFEADPEGKDRFRFSNYSFQFEMGAGGKARSFTMNALRVWNLRFEKRAAQ